MSLDSQDVLKIAHLARLHLPGDEIERYAGELSAILDFAEQINVADTAGVVPMAHPLDLVQPLRPDVVTEHDRREELQAGAPTVRDGLYLVPRVVE